MAPLIILIRHGQAVHNIDNNWVLRDPALTDAGRAECKVLADRLQPKFHFTKDECCIVVSPLTRTLETVQYGLKWLRDQGVPAQVRAEWQETTDNPCDVGGEPGQVKQQWPDFDFSDLDPVYPEKTGLYENSEAAFKKRAYFAKEWLYKRPEKCIVVVSHRGFLRRVVGEPRFENGEYRTYKLVQTSSDYHLQEVDLESQQEA
ncbi:phosphoglycerate mutase-like protein [Hypoxylon trugodes]|uniref:phosphoglycerate mutase-like protein n=1 Tax=Hypoxylon trugodes TaxID=326681 RepID=UPI00219A229E|nr:phosphoglycerate mutase-like protein [Hypoxylon trugodes]KAI1390150.1 phosphoglycerate mutase-like protein [Hypoxylon trugodes]